jgi:hypothetical protein
MIQRDYTGSTLPLSTKGEVAIPRSNVQDGLATERRESKLSPLLLEQVWGLLSGRGRIPQVNRVVPKDVVFREF